MFLLIIFLNLILREELKELKFKKIVEGISVIDRFLN